MNEKISKTNDSQGFLNQRIDEIPMSVGERLRAKAQLARAEAFADFLVGIVRALRSLGHAAPKTPRHPAPTAG